MTRRAANLLFPVAIALLAAAPAWAKTSDRNQTMDVKANGSDCSLNDNGNCVLTGDVHIVQGTLDIQSARADMKRVDGEAKSVKLTGAPVRMKQQSDDGGWVNATASQIDYDLPNDTIVLTGNASVQQPGKGSIDGGRIVYNTSTGQVQSGGAAGNGERVSMRFEPKKKDPAKPAATPKDKPQDGASQGKK